MANCGNATPEAKRGFQSDAVCRAFKQAIIAQNNLCPKQKVEDLCKPKVSCVSTPAKEHPKCWSSGPKGVILSKCRFRKGFISPIPKILDPKANSILREVSPNKKISSNRMHSLESVNDLRSWGLNVDERRRYFLEQMSPRANENEQEEQHDDGFLQIVEANSDDVINGKTVVNTDFIGPSSSQQSVVPGSAPPPEIAHGSSEAAETASSHGSTYRVPSQHPSANESHRNTSKSSISQNGFSPGNAENTSGSLQKKEDSLASVTIPRVNEPLNHQQNRSPDLAPTESSREVSSLQEGERGSISGPKDKRGSSSSLPEERRDSGTSQSNEKKSSISSGLGERKSSSSGPHEERKTSGSSQPGVKSDSTASISDERKALDSSQREEKMVSGSSLPENARNEPCALTNDNLPGPQGTNWNELANQQASRLNEVDGQVLIETCKTQIDQLKMALCNERKLNEEYKRQIYNLQQQLTNGQGGVGLPGMPASQEKCYEDQIGYLREQLARMEEVNKNLEQEYACEKATFDQFYNQVAGLEAEYNRLASAAGEMEKDLENRARSEQSVQKQLIDFNALVSSQKNEIARLAAENQVLKNDIDQIQAQMGDHMNSAASNTKQNDQSKPGVQEHPSALTIEMYFKIRSYRKALIWQKNYLLISILAHKDILRDINGINAHHSDLLQKQIPLTPNAVGKANMESMLTRFRIAGRVVIATIRMKWMTKRWSQKLGGIGSSSSSLSSKQNSPPSSDFVPRQTQRHKITKRTREFPNPTRLHDQADHEDIFVRPRNPTLPARPNEKLIVASAKSSTHSSTKKMEMFSGYIERLQYLEETIGRNIKVNQTK